MMAGRIVGGLLVRLNGHLFATSVRHEMIYAPVCWRCGGALYLDTARLAPGNDEGHVWVWIGPCCATNEDDAALAAPEGRGVR